jgi:AcrR family transcriptional regulator
MMAARPHVELLEKHKPRQARAKRTYDAILHAAAELLVEVGVERISTNLIAERAGITVPALYRYFPNKYSVLNALGASLMDRQNEVFQLWLEDADETTTVDTLLDDLYGVLKETYEVTLAQVGGAQIMQCLRAVGPLQEVRLESHRIVSAEIAASISALLNRPMDMVLGLQVRLAIDVGYSAIELALEDQSLSPENILRQCALMLRLYLHDILIDSVSGVKG